MQEPDLGGLGGRDIVHQDGVPIHKRARLVGTVQWFGRVIHNHHIGTIHLKQVDILKGVNMSFRAAALDDVGFDTDLKGKGAQVCLDMAISLAVRKNWRLAYDPAVLVDHFPAKRFDADQRNAPSLQAIEESSYNFYLTVRRYLQPALKRSAALSWAWWIGTTHAPGVIRGLLSQIRGDRYGVAMRIASRAAWISARRDA
jgi:hypothetical protein